MPLFNPFRRRLPTSKRLVIFFVFIWFLIGGIGHFVKSDFFLKIMPPYLPYPLTLIYISGFFELLGAFGLLLEKYRKWAGNGLVLLAICVTPANVYMWQHPDLFSQIPEWLLVFRLIFQVVFIIGIWWSTRPNKRRFFNFS